MFRDIGANLTNKAFAADLSSTLERAQSAGVCFIDVTGTDVASSIRAARMARERPDLLGATAGIHPHWAKDCSPAALLEIERLLALPEVLMCGEMGLDHARNHSTPAQQARAFEAQLDLAQDCGKPLFLHCREAFGEFIEILDRRPHLWSRAIVHCFTGGPDEARALAERGAWFGITGWIADKRRNAPLLSALPLIPLSRMMAESDAPYLMPVNRPKSQTRDRNEPAFVPWVVEAIAQSLGASPEDIGRVLFDNAERLIGRASPAPQASGSSSSSPR